MRVLVTGASGFIAKYVLKELKNRGYDVLCLVRREEAIENLKELGFETQIGDVRSISSLKNLCKDIDAIIHLVGIIKGLPGDFDEVMRKGTENLISVAEKANVRKIIYNSTSISSNENPYLKAKHGAERAIKNSKLKHTIFQTSFVLGRENKIFDLFAQKVTFLPSSKALVQPIWIEDMAKIVVKALDRRYDNKTYQVGGPEAITYNDLLKRVADIYGARAFFIPLWLAKLFAPAEFKVALDLIQRQNVADIKNLEKDFKIKLTSLQKSLELLKKEFYF